MSSSGNPEKRRRSSFGGLSNAVRLACGRVRTTVRTITSCCTLRHQTGVNNMVGSNAIADDYATAKGRTNAPVEQDNGCNASIPEEQDVDLHCNSTSANSNGVPKTHKIQAKRRYSSKTAHSQRSAPSKVIIDIYTLHKTPSNDGKAIRKQPQQNVLQQLFQPQSHNVDTIQHANSPLTFSSLFSTQADCSSFQTNTRHSMDGQNSQLTCTTSPIPIMHSTPKNASELSSSDSFRREKCEGLKYNYTSQNQNGQELHDNLSKSIDQPSACITSLKTSRSFTTNAVSQNSDSFVSNDLSVLVPRDGEVLTSFRRAPPPQRTKRDSRRGSTQSASTPITIEHETFNI